MSNLWILVSRSTQSYCKRCVNGFVAQKIAQHESCELNFIWGNMRTAAWETASDSCLRVCSKEAEEKGSVYVILAKVEYMQSSTYLFVESFYWSYEAAASQEKQSSP